MEAAEAVAVADPAAVAEDAEAVEDNCTRAIKSITIGPFSTAFIEERKKERKKQVQIINTRCIHNIFKSIEEKYCRLLFKWFSMYTTTVSKHLLRKIGVVRVVT